VYRTDLTREDSISRRPRDGLQRKEVTFNELLYMTRAGLERASVD
jgi:hypothetical protein